MTTQMRDCTDGKESLRDSFRRSMRRLAAAVTIIATRDEQGACHGLTATAVTSLSFDPPSVLICVNRSGESHAPLSRPGREFSVNVLALDQSMVAKRFGTPGLRSEAKFSEGQWRMEQGVPSLEGAIVTLYCETDALLAYGSHTVIVGKVKKVALGQEAPMLLYAEGNYCTLSRERPAGP